MKATGVVRKLDELGRIVLPIELRRNLDIKTGDALEIFTNEDSVVLKKYSPGCTFCGDVEKVQNFKGKYVCSMCMKEMAGVTG